MALIKCIECGKEFSDKASACPNCACPVSEMTVKKEVAIEDGALVSTKDAFDEYIKGEFEKIPEYREKIKKINKEFASESEEFEAVDLKIKELRNKQSEVYVRVKEAEAEYEQSCKGLLGAKSKKAKEAKDKLDSLNAEYKICVDENEMKAHKEKKAELESVLYAPGGAKMKKLRELSKEYPYCKFGRIRKVSEDRDATFEEFLKTSREEYIKQEIINYVYNNGALEIETYARLTGFDLYEVLNIAGAEARKSSYSYHMENVQGKNVLVKGPKPDNGIPISASSINYNAAINAFSPKEKKASVLGRAALGAAIAGPAGAVVGAISAMDKNNNKK